MKKLLWISTYAPYDRVAHAGGKTHNYYIKHFQKSNKFDIHLITLSEKEDVDKIDLDKYGIKYQVKVLNGNVLQNIYRKVYNMNSIYNPDHPLCHAIVSSHYKALKDMLYQYAKKETPDIVIMQWTGSAFLMDDVKKLFPDAKTIVIEEDVAFLGYQRKYEEAEKLSTKKRLYKIYTNLKKKELEIISNTDIVLTNNEKDKKLLVDNHINSDKISVLPPFFDNYKNVEPVSDRNSILYYGAMGREENHKCAMWLIDEIMPALSDTDLILEIVGSHPKTELLNRESNRVHIRGYVENVESYFSKALCMAVPLQLGAGIKVKVLEAMSAGIPVLTNHIGIEGIQAEDGEEYFCCEDKQQYIDRIKLLYQKPEMGILIGKAAREFIHEQYNLDQSLDQLIDRIQ